MPSPYLQKALKGAPEAVRKSVVEGAEAAARKVPQSSGAFILDMPLSLVPPVKRGVARAYDAVSKTLRKGDIAAGEQLKRVPAIGRIFKTKETIPVADLPGGAKLKAEVPVGKLTNPVMATGRFATPLLAYMGAESLIGPKEHKKMSSNGTCGHNELLTKQAQALEDSAGVIQTLQTQRDWLLDKLATLEHRQDSEKTAQLLVDRGFMDSSEFETKVAEFMLGTRKLSTVHELLDFNPAGGIPPIGEVEQPAGAAAGGTEENEAVTYLENM